MKKLFFTLIMASYASLYALSSESSSLEKIIAENIFSQEQGKLTPFQRKGSCGSKERRCLPGPAGPQGIQGPVGPTGPQGPSGPLYVAYGSVYTEESNTVLYGDNYPFTSITPAYKDVLLINDSGCEGCFKSGNGGDLVLCEPGDYHIVFGISLNAPPGDISNNPLNRVDLTLNGMLVQGSNINVPFNSTPQMVTASTIVRVESPHSVLRLINASSFQEQSEANSPGQVVAFITAERLHDSFIP